MQEYRTLKPPQWRAAADRVELWDGERWVGLSPWTEALLRAVEQNAPLADLARAIPARKHADERARRFVFNLARLGYVEVPTPPMPVLLAGRYERDKELGRGGVGVAWRYRDREQGGAPVVVKRAWEFLQPYRITEEAMRREAGVMRALDHPGIARYLGEEVLDDHLHLVREYLDGRDLLALAGTGIPDARERHRVVAAIADALAHLHERGYLLIDLRPANFLLRGPAREPVLLDVGQCRRHEGGSLTFVRRIGSPGFVSPEMDVGKTVTTRSDLWGLGRLLAYLGTGKLPTPRTTLAALVERAPAEDRALLARLCADDPAQRPADAREAGALLRPP